MRSYLICAALMIATPALSQDVTDAEAQLLPRLIDSLCIDLVDDLNGCETAVLLTSEMEEDTADLVLFSDRRTGDGADMLQVVRSITFNGPIFGQSPSLEQAENGSLLLHAEQVGIGRSPWTETVTIAFREDAFVVAGRRYDTYDRLTAGGFSCDVNLLTGDWVVEAERANAETGDIIYSGNDTGRIDGAHVPLAGWSWTRPLPAPCSAALDAWWAAEPQ